MGVDQSSPRSDLLPHHSDEGNREFPIEDIQSSVEGLSAAFPYRKVSATTIMSAAALTGSLPELLIGFQTFHSWNRQRGQKPCLTMHLCRSKTLAYSGSCPFIRAFANKGTTAEKGSRECEKSFLTSLPSYLDWAVATIASVPQCPGHHQTCLTVTWKSHGSIVTWSPYLSDC
jgi:hypothetical protein